MELSKLEEEEVSADRQGSTVSQDALPIESSVEPDSEVCNL